MVMGEVDFQFPEQGDGAGEVCREISKEGLAPREADGCDATDVWDDQKECVLAVVRNSIFSEDDIQRR
jgi:hypothetical protein